MRKIFSNQNVRYGLFIALGLILGRFLFHSPEKMESGHNQSIEEAKSQIWTCSMHPQIRKEEPGKCPICAMDLILLNQSGAANIDPESIHFTQEAAQLANVLTTVVSKDKPIKEVRLYGKVQADERLLQNQVAYFPGRVEKLMVNFTGEEVRQGQVLASIYSPELITAQQELLEATKSKKAQPEIYEAAKEKLRQWKLTENQISAILNSGKVQSNLEVVSTVDGIVTARKINNGDYVSQGMVLYEVSDLSSVWVLFDAYESDLQFINKGDQIEFAIQALPGTSFSGRILFIDPVIDPVNRVAKVRVEVKNAGGKLKPEMFANGTIKANLDALRDQLVIPRSAVLWTGKRSIVYVKQPGNEPIFKIREIGLGPVLGNSYVVTDGLNEGEEIVTQGTFSVDAAAQLEGKPSMMNVELRGNLEIGGNKEIDGNKEIGGNGEINGNKPIKIQFKVWGSCGMCKDRIETTAKSVSGVVLAVWDISSKQLAVQFDPDKTSPEAIQKAIAKVGHDTEKFKARDDVYNKLPECCLYRKL
jgi:Cu(I)/Ag(I) efflux system membrane fusion protein